MFVILVFNFICYIMSKLLKKNHYSLKSSNMFINFLFLNLNQINKNLTNEYFTIKVVQTSSFFFRFVSKKIHNHSLFSHYSYFPKIKSKLNDYLYINYNYFGFISFNKDCYYWLNNYIVHERYNPFSVRNSVLMNNNQKYIYI